MRDIRSPIQDGRSSLLPAAAWMHLCERPESPTEARSGHHTGVGRAFKSDGRFHAARSGRPHASRRRGPDGGGWARGGHAPCQSSAGHDRAPPTPSRPPPTARIPARQRPAGCRVDQVRGRLRQTIGVTLGARLLTALVVAHVVLEGSRPPARRRDGLGLPRPGRGRRHDVGPTLAAPRLAGVAVAPGVRAPPNPRGRTSTPRSSPAITRGCEPDHGAHPPRAPRRAPHGHEQPAPTCPRPGLHPGHAPRGQAWETRHEPCPTTTRRLTPHRWRRSPAAGRSPRRPANPACRSGHGSGDDTRRSARPVPRATAPAGQRTRHAPAPAAHTSIRAADHT